MSILKTRTPCSIRKRNGTDLYGQINLAPPTPETCSVVRAKQTSQHTTVRADASGSRGFAQEFVMSNKILLSKNTIAKIDDQLIVLGFLIQINMLHPRLDVWGRLDHYEVEGSPWG